MDLICRVTHLWGQQVNVGGQLVSVASNGLVLGLEESIAKRLLQDASGWAIRPGSLAAPVAQPAQAAPRPAAVVAAPPVAAPVAPAPAPEAEPVRSEVKKPDEPVARTRRRGGEEK